MGVSPRNMQPTPCVRLTSYWITYLEEPSGESYCRDGPPAGPTASLPSHPCVFQPLLRKHAMRPSRTHMPSTSVRLRPFSESLWATCPTSVSRRRTTHRLSSYSGKCQSRYARSYRKLRLGRCHNLPPHLGGNSCCFGPHCTNKAELAPPGSWDFLISFSFSLRCSLLW